MRVAFVALAVAGIACGQAMTEVGAAVAGGAVGGVAGKQVGLGLAGVFDKFSGQTAKAASSGDATKQSVSRPAGGDATPVLQVGPGVPKANHSLVPPPPPVRRAATAAPAPPPPPTPQPVIVAAVVPPPPPPPQATPDDLRGIEKGTPRADVLKLGAPASRVMMYEDGHLLEIYRYMAGDLSFGVVRLSDGTVSSVLVR